MIKVVEAKGETIDSAVQKALLSLGKERDDVSVEVVQKPKSGFLGIGKEPAIVKVSFNSSPADAAVEFLKGLLMRLGVTADIKTSEDEAERVIGIELSGENMGSVIGRRGDTLDAIQYLTSIVVNQKEDERWRVTVDTENYRAKREEALKALAQKTAQKALKFKKGVALEPMNPHERRIIHSSLQDMEGITTYSTGSEPNRKVIVAPAGEKPRTGGAPQGARKGGGNGPRRSGGYRGKKPQAPKTEAPKAE